METWQPPLPNCVTLMRAQATLIIRDTPSEQGRKRGSLPASAIIRIDKTDRCLLYGGQYRYVRLVSWGRIVYPEPLYVALEKVEVTGYRQEKVLATYLKVYRDEC